MTYEELKEIKLRLDKWREERHLNYESQQKGFIPNVLDELREYYLAKDDDERVAELCDIVIYCLNANELEKFKLNDKGCASFWRLMDNLAGMISTDYKGLKLDFKSESALARTKGLIETCINIIKRMGYNPYECLSEKVKEIESRSGKYDESLGKFIKDIGAYTQEEAQELIYARYEKDFITNFKEQDDYFSFHQVSKQHPNLAVIKRIKKWHKARIVKNA